MKLYISYWCKNRKLKALRTKGSSRDGDTIFQRIDQLVGSDFISVDPDPNPQH